MSAGSIVGAVNAKTCAGSIEYCDANDCTPSGSVYDPSLFKMNRGKMYEFQLATNAKIPVVMTPGIDSGTTIRKKNPRRLAPSIEAASSNSLGIARRNGTKDRKS